MGSTSGSVRSNAGFLFYKMLVLLAGAYRHYQGNITTVLLYVRTVAHSVRVLIEYTAPFDVELALT